MGSKSTYRPWNSGSSLVQISIIARRRSSVSLPRVLGSVPWFSISSRFQPTPTPKTARPPETRSRLRSQEHTSELQSRQYLVCRLLLEKKKNVSVHLQAL